MGKVLAALAERRFTAGCALACPPCSKPLLLRLCVSGSPATLTEVRRPWQASCRESRESLSDPVDPWNLIRTHLPHVVPGRHCLEDPHTPRAAARPRPQEFCVLDLDHSIGALWQRPACAQGTGLCC